MSVRRSRPTFLNLLESVKEESGGQQCDSPRDCGTPTLSIQLESPQGSSHRLLGIDNCSELTAAAAVRHNDAEEKSQTLLKKGNLRMDDLLAEDLQNVRELGRGSGCTVYETRHKPSGIPMARKVIQLGQKQGMRQQIVRDLHVLHRCYSPFIVTYYGIIFTGQNMSLCMEYMNAGSLDAVMHEAGRVPEPIISRVAWSVLMAIQYLQDKVHIVHRNVKPSNILVNLDGEVKLVDASVSNELNDLSFSSFVSCKNYLAPEVIRGSKETTSSDLWSLGLTLYELAMGCHPIPELLISHIMMAFHKDQHVNMSQHEQSALKGLTLPVVKCSSSTTLSLFQLMSCMVDNRLAPPPEFCFSQHFPTFLEACLQNDTETRSSVHQLLQHPFVVNCGIGVVYSTEIFLYNYFRQILKSSTHS